MSESDALHPSAPAEPAPLAAPPAPSFSAQLARTFIEGNWFYVLSGILMVIGCHQLVRSMLLTGSELVRTGISLGILQAYELLVIATAIIIVRKLKLLGDAYTLFIVEAALLLDPTFFSNSLGTISSGRGLWINTACFLLLPIKLLILQSFLRIRPRRGAWAAFVLAGAIIYLSPWLHMQKQPALTMHGNYLLVGWLISVVAVLYPPAPRMISIDEPVPGYASATQRHWLPRFWISLPLIVVASHYFESSSVYTIPFFPAFVAPVLLAAAGLVVNNSQAGEPLSQRIAYLDALVLIALGLCLPALNKPDWLAMSRPAHAQPTLLLGTIPLLICGAATAGLYLLLYYRARAVAALYHIGALAAAGILYLIYKSGLVQSAALQVRNTAVEGARWTVEHPAVLFGPAAAVALWLAYRKRTYMRYLAAGVLLIAFVLSIVPSPRGGLVPEGLQAFVIMGVVMSHLFVKRTEQSQRATAVALVMACAVARFANQPAPWSGAIVVVQFTAFITAGWLLGYKSYVVVAAIQLALFAYTLVKMYHIRLHAAAFAIAAGLLMFAIAVYVTFRKARAQENASPSPLANSQDTDGEASDGGSSSVAPS